MLAILSGLGVLGEHFGVVALTGVACLMAGLPAAAMLGLFVASAVGNALLSIRSAFNQTKKHHSTSELMADLRGFLPKFLILCAPIAICFFPFRLRFLFGVERDARDQILLQMPAIFKDSKAIEKVWFLSAYFNFFRIVASPMILLSAVIFLGVVSGPVLPFLVSPFLSILVVSVIAATTFVVSSWLKSRCAAPGSKAFDVLACAQVACVLVPFLWFGLSVVFPAAAIALPVAMSFLAPLATSLGPTLAAALSAPLLVGLLAGCAAGVTSVVQWVRDKCTTPCPSSKDPQTALMGRVQPLRAPQQVSDDSDYTISARSYCQMWTVSQSCRSGRIASR
jgi:hypothetical protein